MLLVAFQPLLGLLSESAIATEPAGSLPNSVPLVCVDPIVFVGFIIISLQNLASCGFVGFLFVCLFLFFKHWEVIKIGVRIKRLSQHPSPETTLQGMNK